MSINDPQWGRKGGSGGGDGGGKREGPPDLDELWRNFNQRLAGLFGRRGNGTPPPSGGATPPPSLRQLGGGVGMLILLALVVWAASGIFTVDARQKAIVFWFGQKDRIAGEGLNWRFPYPFQTHELVNIQNVRNVEIGYQEIGGAKRRVPKEALMLTDDENVVDVQLSVQYLVKDPEEYLFNNRAPEDTVKQVAESAIREVVGKSKMDFVLYVGRDKVANDTAKLMQNILDRYKAGISVLRVNMQDSAPPEQVKAAFDDAVKAQQDRERQKNEGEAYANDVIPKARGAAARLIEEANGYRTSTVANAEGEAARFKQVLLEYERAPVVTRERLYLETIQQVMSTTTKVVVDSRQGQNMMVLPLDRLIQMTGAEGSGAAPRAPTVEAPPPPTVPEPGLRSREALRGRERDSR